MLATTALGAGGRSGRAANARSQNSCSARRDVELAEQVDALGGDRQRRAARGEHPQFGRRRDQERHELGHRPDQVLAVVEHQQAW